MYLAEHIIRGRRQFVLRDSLYDPDDKCWKSRDLYDLGSSPWNYIKYPGGNSFYIDEKVIDELAAQDIEHDLCELEELFWVFIRKEIRQKLEPFHCRGLRSGRKKGKTEGETGQQIQVFDKRRLFYLRSGAVDQRRIARVPRRFFSALLQKSRDEIEQYFIQLEKSLKPGEYKQYVYVIFDLQRHFAGSSLRLVPQSLDQEKLDAYFMGDLCRLDRDEFFWAGFATRDRLHEYLVRYTIMFWDYEFDGGSAWEEYLQDFMNSKRFYRNPPLQSRFSMIEVVEIFGVSEEDLNAMSKSELTKLYRQKAHEFHPDKGGEHEAFVRLTKAYQDLLRKK